MDTAAAEHKSIKHERSAQGSEPRKLNKAISPAERRILDLAIKGKTDKMICRELNLSITTVRTHWARLRKKLGVANRAQAIAESMEMESSEELKVMHARLRAMNRVLNHRGLGVWEWHAESDQVVADELASRIFGCERREEPMPLEQFLCALPGVERDRICSQLRQPKLGASAEGITHALRGTTDARSLQARTRMARVVSGEKTFIVCTTETVHQR